MDQILIEGLKLNVVIGAFHWERQVQQPVEIDLVLYTCIKQAARTDKLEDAVNYKAVVDHIKNFMQTQAYHLLEAAAEAITTLVFNDFAGVKKIELTLHKPLALYRENVSNVGLRIIRERPAS